MEVKEKVEMAVRKKLIGVKLLKEKDYERALVIFGHINSLFSLGNFDEA